MRAAMFAAFANLSEASLLEGDVMHGTKRQLLECAIGMLETSGPNQLLIDDVLTQSGVSKGSLYYHFEDFPHLVESALVELYRRDVDRAVEYINEIRATANCADDLVAAISLINARIHAPAFAKVRFQRAFTIAMAGFSPRLAEAIAPVQKRFIDSLAQFIAEAQAAGWASNDYEPRAAAMLIQAYTLGRLGNDFSPAPVQQQDWLDIINLVIRRVLAAG